MNGILAFLGVALLGMIAGGILVTLAMIVTFARGMNW